MLFLPLLTVIHRASMRRWISSPLPVPARIYPANSIVAFPIATTIWATVIGRGLRETPEGAFTRPLRCSQTKSALFLLAGPDGLVTLTANERCQFLGFVLAELGEGVG